MPTLRLTKFQADDLSAICALGLERLQRIARTLGTLPLTIKRSVLTQAITDEVGKDAAKSLERFLFGLAAARRRGMPTITTLLDYLRQSLITQNWAPDALTQWDNTRPIIEQLLALPSVAATAKAMDLSYDFARLCAATRILTDIRPIFDEEDGRRTKIIGATITQTLRIDCFSPVGDEQTISVTLDIEDIKQLRASCDAAISKAEKARRLMEDTCKTPTIMPGEEDTEC